MLATNCDTYARPRVSNHAIDRYIERARKPTKNRDQCVTKILELWRAGKKTVNSLEGAERRISKGWTIYYTNGVITTVWRPKKKNLKRYGS